MAPDQEIQVQISPRSMPYYSRATLSICRWLGGVERGVLLSAHEHALRNPSRRGQTVPSGTGDLARTPRPETRCAPNDNGGSRAQRERWLQKLDRLRNRGTTGKTGVPLQEILDDIRGERC
jgi:hypothetical protein